MTVIRSSEFPSVLVLLSETLHNTILSHCQHSAQQKLMIKILTVSLRVSDPTRGKLNIWWREESGQKEISSLSLWKTREMLTDPILRGHLCLSMGKSSRFIIHVAIIVSLWEYRTLPLGNSLESRERDNSVKVLISNLPYKTVRCGNCMKIAFLPIINFNCTIRNGWGGGYFIGIHYLP